MSKKKVSFDFDDTLSNGRVQHHARKMKRNGCELWIVTSRVPDSQAPSDGWNNDLFFVADQLSIPEERIVFCAYGPKYEFFWEGNDDFLFHLDDDIDEVNGINNMTEMDAFHFPFQNKDGQLEVLNKLQRMI